MRLKQVDHANARFGGVNTDRGNRVVGLADHVHIGPDKIEVEIVLVARLVSREHGKMQRRGTYGFSETPLQIRVGAALKRS